MADYPPFATDSKCPKCGGTLASYKYHDGKTRAPGETFEGEHMHRRCNMCGAERAEKPLN